MRTALKIVWSLLVIAVAFDAIVVAARSSFFRETVFGVGAETGIAVEYLPVIFARLVLAGFLGAFAALAIAVGGLFAIDALTRTEDHS